MFGYVITAMAIAILIGIAVKIHGKVQMRKDWVEAHDGNLIGSEEFFAWCNENGVDPMVYW